MSRGSGGGGGRENGGTVPSHERYGQPLSEPFRLSPFPSPGRDEVPQLTDEFGGGGAEHSRCFDGDRGEDVAAAEV